MKAKRDDGRAERQGVRDTAASDVCDSGGQDESGHGNGHERRRPCHDKSPGFAGTAGNPERAVMTLPLIGLSAMIERVGTMLTILPAPGGHLPSR